jgi:hypothetical protein
VGAGSTIAAELADSTRFASPKKLCGYTGLCPRVSQSGSREHRGPLAKNGPSWLRWALIEAATHAARHPVYRDHGQASKRRLGAQRGSAVARVEIARKLTQAIWHLLTKQPPFAAARPTLLLWPHDGPRRRWAHCPRPQALAGLAMVAVVTGISLVAEDRSDPKGPPTWSLA